MRRRAALIFVAFAAVVALWHALAREPVESLEREITVFAGDGSPAAGAAVRVLLFPERRSWRDPPEVPRAALRGRADEKGRVVAGLPLRPGIVLAEAGAERGWAELVGRAIAVEMAPPGLLRIAVSGTAGPIAGAEARVLVGAWIDGTCAEVCLGVSPPAVRTGDDGGAEVETYPGLHRLVVRAPGHVPYAGDAQVLPGTVVRVPLSLARAAPLTGRVVDERGAPIAGASVRAWKTFWTREPPADEARTSRDGRFVLDELAPGTRWTIHVEARGRRPKRLETAPADLGEIALGRGARLEVEIDGRAPEEGASLARISLGSLTTAAVPLYDEAPRVFPRTLIRLDEEIGEAALDEAGRATFKREGLPPGEWVLDVEAGSSLWSPRVVLREGEATRVRLAVGDPVLTGTIRDTRGRPRAGSAWLEVDRRARRLVAHAGSDGRFTFGALPDGRYVLWPSSPGATGHSMAVDVPARDVALVVTPDETGTDEPEEWEIDDDRYLIWMPEFEAACVGTVLTVTRASPPAETRVFPGDLVRAIDGRPTYVPCTVTDYEFLRLSGKQGTEGSILVERPASGGLFFPMTFRRTRKDYAPAE